MRALRGPTSRLAWLVLVIGVLLAAAAGPAGAGVGPDDGLRDRDRRIAVGDILVAADEEVDGPVIGIDGDTLVEGAVEEKVVVINGDLLVTETGSVDDDIVVIRGDARIDGRVDGNVTAIRGRAIVGPQAVVDGDVRSSERPRVARGARVTGDVEDIDLAGIIAAIGAGLLLFWWLAVTISTAVLGALVVALLPRGVESAAAAGRSRNQWWVAALVGVGLVLVLPFVAIAAASSIIGLPFGLGLLGALGLVHALGYVAGAFFLGRLILRTANRFGAFFLGWAILRAVALVPGLGLLGWIVAATFGLGTLAVAGFVAGQGTRPAVGAAPPPDAPPPDAPPPGAPPPAEPDAPATAPTSPLERPSDPSPSDPSPSDPSPSDPSPSDPSSTPERDA